MFVCIICYYENGVMGYVCGMMGHTHGVMGMWWCDELCSCCDGLWTWCDDLFNSIKFTNPILCLIILVWGIFILITYCVMETHSSHNDFYFKNKEASN